MRSAVKPVYDPTPPASSRGGRAGRVDGIHPIPYPQGFVRRAGFSPLTALIPLLLAGTSRAAPATTVSSASSGIRLRAILPSGPPPAIMPLADVKAGMVGEALTVFQGTKPEPFKVRVVSVLRHFLPKPRDDADLDRLRQIGRG